MQILPKSYQSRAQLPRMISRGAAHYNKPKQVQIYTQIEGDIEQTEECLNPPAFLSPVQPPQPW